MADNRIRINTKGIEKLGKALGDEYSIKVGIMGSKAQQKHNDTTLTNAQIGALNEYGSARREIPRRSFLREPLQEHLATYLKSKKAFSEKEIDQAVKEGTLLDLAKKVGVVAEQVIQEAFATRGFGKWKPNAPSTIARKGSDSPLIDTGQLRRSITSKVDKR